MEKILITGALGHIGSKLIHSIQADEFDGVYLIDNLSTQRYSSLFNLPNGVKFNFIEEDIVTADLDKYFTGIDVVIHLAALTDASTSHDHKEEVERVNVYGSQRVAEACIRSGCRLIFPSTTSVYGIQKNLVNEDCPKDELKPQSPYAESKIKAEQMLEFFGESKQLKYVIFRFGTIFGTSIGMRFHTAVNKFCWQATMGQPITVWKTALHQMRPYAGVNDAINAIRFVIKNNQFNQKIYNVVTLNTSVDEIINCIRKNGLQTKIEFVDSRIMNQLSYNVSGAKFEKNGFVYQDQLDKGISDTIALLRNAHVQLI